jgi:hypothetical protein
MIAGAVDHLANAIVRPSGENTGSRSVVRIGGAAGAAASTSRTTESGSESLTPAR